MTYFSRCQELRSNHVVIGLSKIHFWIVRVQKFRALVETELQESNLIDQWLSKTLRDFEYERKVWTTSKP